MKHTMLRILSLTLLLGLFSFTGCGKNDDAASAGRETTAPETVSPDVSFEITGNDQMKFNRTQLTVKPGAVVQIKLTNIGKMPAMAMSHNLVVLTADADAQAFATAAASQSANQYFPSSLADQVIAHTRMLGPNESDTITFTAPTEPGDYEYICTFPGHFAAGMKGILSVETE